MAKLAQKNWKEEVHRNLGRASASHNEGGKKVFEVYGNE